MAEKSDIPALYNDMSQSQETSLKPWTPKKIVISQKDKSEIVLEGQQQSDEVIEETELPIPLPQPAPVPVEKEVVVVEKPMPSTPVSKKQSLRNQSKLQQQQEEQEQLKKSESDNVRCTRNMKRTNPLVTATEEDKLKDNDDSVIKRTRRSGLRTKNDNKKSDETSNDKLKTTNIEKQNVTENISTPNKATNVAPVAKTLPPINEEAKSVEDKNSLNDKDKENILHEQETQLQTMETVTQSVTPTITTSEIVVPEIVLNPPPKSSVEKTNEDNEIMNSNKKDDISNTNNSNKKTNTIEILSNELIDLNSKTTNAITEIIQTKEVSPKKTTTRFTPLSSPPDRRLTNNSSSPTLRPKPSSHLTGRGAQLINMIRNKKVDIAAATSATSAAASSSFSTAATSSPAIHSTPQQRNPAVELMELTGTDHTSTPVQHKDFLIFSKRLPSPTASPSASILKRKLGNDSIEDLSFDSPAFKRKRVSFHDPPVSVTKEYLRDIDETKTKPKRCLIMDKVSEAKHVLRRRSKLDSLIEIEKFNTIDMNAEKTNAAAPSSNQQQTANNNQQMSHNTTTATCSTVASNALTTTQTCSTINKSTDRVMDDSISSLKWNDSRNTTNDNNASNVENHPLASTSTHVEDPLNTSIRAHACNHPEPTKQQLNLDTAIEMVLEQCSLETILEKYFAHESSPQLKSSNTVAKFLSNAMETHTKIKTNVLETLSENHSKDFLDHAVQENLSSVVCDRLNLNSVIDYICAKSKINSACRNNLLQQLPDILKHSKNDNERFEFIKNTMEMSQFSDEHILELINLLMQVRCGKRGGEHTAMVSESAVDSSSNL